MLGGFLTVFFGFKISHLYITTLTLKTALMQIKISTKVPYIYRQV